VNLTDEMFQGIYRSKVIHPDDFQQVLQRGRDNGVKYFMSTSGTYNDTIESLKYCNEHDDVFTTVGMHPTRCTNFETGEPIEGQQVTGENLLAKMKEIITKNQGKIVAIGECGLDYDRLKFCPKDTQLKWFEKQLELAKETKLPMFLHMRAAGDDFIEIVKKHREGIAGGVVHSFTGTQKELEQLLDLDFFIGINGCSLKTEENVQVVRNLPLSRLMLETDGPWCGLRPSYAGTKFVETKFPTKKKERWEEGHCVKDRNEPCHMIQIAEAVAGILDKPLEEVINAAYENTMRMFFPQEEL